MAIENAKLLNVRIKNKYDSYENWASSGLILERGEIAIAYTTVDVKVDNGTAKHPALLMKVGDGEKTFANLPWLSAKAADVLSVCKNETDLTAFVNGVIADAGIASDAAMKELAGKVTTAEGAIDALEELVGTDKVADQIAAAIAALNLDTTYEKVNVAKGLVDALAGGAVKDNADAIAAIKDGETLDSFADVETELAKYQLSGNYSEEGHKHVKADITDFAHNHEMSEVNGLNDTLALKAAKSDLEALAGKVGEVPADQTVMGIINEIQENAYDDTTLKAEIEGKLALKADQTSLDAVSAVANAAVKQADYDVKVKALEDEDARIVGLVEAEAERAAGVESGLEERLVEVETFFKTAEGETLDTALDTLVEIQKYLDGEGEVADQMLLDIAANKKAIEDHEKINHDFVTADKELKSELRAEINAKADASTVTNLETALDARLDILEAINHEAYKTADATLKSELEGKIALKADAKTVSDMDAAYKAADVALDARLDVLEAINHDAYIAADTTLKTELNTAIALKADKTVVEGIDGRLVTAEGKLAGIEAGAEVNLIEAVKVNGEALTVTDKAVNVLVPTGALASKDKVAEDDLAIELATKINDKADKSALETAKTDLTTEINKKANNADLAAIAKSGSTDDLVQGTMTLVFDCGTSAE